MILISVSCISDELKVIVAGRGTPGEHCGSPVWKFCFDCNHHFVSTHNCMKRSCPNCYNKWAWRQAQPTTEKILFNRAGREILHGVVSFEGKPDEIIKFRRRAYDCLKEHGILSGVVIPHHERHGRVDGYLHYHFLGFLRRNDNYLPGEPGRVLFKVIRWIHGPGDLCKTVHYFLTHCSIVNGRHAITYFGEKFKKPRTKQKTIDEWCPHCHKYAVRTVPIIDYNGGDEITLWGGCSVEGGG